MNELKEIIKEKIKYKKNYDEVRESLVKEGYLEEEFEKELDEIIKEDELNKKKAIKKDSHKIFAIEGLSKFGSGLLSNQYLNVIIYLLSSKNLFFVGIITTIRYVLSLFSSFRIEKKLQSVSPSKIKLFLISFTIAVTSMVMGYSLMIKNLYVFVTCFIILGYFLNTFNKTYLYISKQLVKNEKRGFLFRRLAFIMISFSIIGLFIGAIILDKLHLINHSKINFDPYSLLLFLIYSFIYYTIAFLILISFNGLKDFQLNEKKSIISELKNSIDDIKIFFKDRLLSLLFVAAFLTLFVATIGNSFYGIYIFEQMNAFGNLRFLRIAIIFSVTIVASLIGPHIAKINSHGSGKMVMMVFGTFLSAFLPFFLAISPIVKGNNASISNLMVISFAALVSFIGISIVGSAFGMVITDLVPTEHRKKFFNSNQVALIIPSLIFMPIASYIAQIFGLKVLFMSLAILTVFLITPLYFLIIIINERKKKTRIRKIF